MTERPLFPSPYPLPQGEREDKSLFSTEQPRTLFRPLMKLDDTIVAVSSPAGPGRRAILRLSGPDALAIADRVFTPSHASSLSSWPTFAARPGRLEPPGTCLSAPAVAYLMRGPRSYTREDVVEFHVGAWPALEGLMV